MRLFRRLKTKYGISHPFYVLSLAACLVFCVLITGYALLNYESGTGYGTDAVSYEWESDEFVLFAEEIFDTVIGSYSQVVAIGIEPILAVMVQGGISLLNAVIGMPLDLETTIFSVPEVLLITLVIYSVGKILQCFECTRSFTMLTYGEFERIFGYFMLISIACQNVMKVIYICEKHKPMLESLFYGLKAEWAIAILVFGVGVISSFAGILIFYITKTLILGLQIMQLSVSFLPFTSLLFEVLRSSVTVLMALFNLLFPRMGFAFNCAMFIIGIILLSQTSSSVEYFRVIYLESILIPYYRFKGKVGELYKEVPTEISKKCQKKQALIVPVFSMEQFYVGDVLIKAHEKWWMEIAEDGLHFYRKKVLSKQVESFVIPKEKKKWYFKDQWKCLELFDLNGPEENIIRLFKKPDREVVFAVSREYEAVFQDITEGICATDYNALKQKLTEERRNYIENENKAFYAATQ